MMTSIERLLGALSAPLLALSLFAGSTGCDDQSVETSPTNTGGGDTNGADAIAADEVELTYGADSVRVNVAKLATEDYLGTEVVPLSVIWSTGALAADVSKLEFDFEGSDGFHPSMKGKCKTNMAGTQLGAGYMAPDTRTLVWDSALGLPGCYHVHDVVKIIALDVAP